MDTTPAFAAGASVADKFGRIRKIQLLTPRLAAGLLPVELLALQAGLLRSDAKVFETLGVDPGPH